MKIRLVTAVVGVLLGAAMAGAQSKGVKINLDDSIKSAPAGKVDPNKPATKADAKKTDAKKKEGEKPKIEGIEIQRGDTYMGIQLVNGTFKLSFYDAKKQPVPPDVTRAVLRWKNPNESLPQTDVLNPDGQALASPKVIKPPHTFSLSIILFKGEGEDAKTENFTVDFHP